jgi:hypothetical protein
VRRNAPDSVSGEARCRAMWSRAADGPKIVGRRAPVESCGRWSEDCRSSYPGEAVRAVRRSAPSAVPRGVVRQGRRSDPGAVPRWPGALPLRAGTGVRGRGSDAMMLRSAEADPHVIEHMRRSDAEAPGDHVKSPCRSRRRSDDNAADDQTTAGADIAPSSRAEALPTSRRRPPGFRSRSYRTSGARRPHPPRWADD